MRVQNKLVNLLPLAIFLFVLFVLFVPVLQKEITGSHSSKIDSLLSFDDNKITGSHSFDTQAIPIAACQNLTTKGETYDLATHVSTSKRFCFVIQNHSITLRCNNKDINGSSINTTLIQNNGFVNLTLVDCIFKNATAGINLTSANNTVIQKSLFTTPTTFVNMTSDCIIINNSNHVQIRDAYMTKSGRGIYIPDNTPTITNLTVDELVMTNLNPVAGGGGLGVGAISIRPTQTTGEYLVNSHFSNINMTNVSSSGIDATHINNSIFTDLIFINVKGTRGGADLGGVDVSYAFNNTIQRFRILGGSFSGGGVPPFPVDNFEIEISFDDFRGIILGKGAVNNTIYDGVIDNVNPSSNPLLSTASPIALYPGLVPFAVADVAYNNFSRINVLNTTGCIFIERDSGGASVHDNTFEHILCNQTTGVGIAMIGGADNYFNDVNITNNNGSMMVAGMSFAAGVLYFSMAATTSGNVINDCYISGATQHSSAGIQMFSIAGVSDMNVTNSVIEGFNNSIIGYGYGNSLFEGNTFRNALVDGVFLDGTMVASDNNIIRNNSFNYTIANRSIVFSSSNNNLVYYNNFYNFTGFHAWTDVATNEFNTTVAGIAQGNYWQGIESLDIQDLNADGWGDAGTEYPYNSTNKGNVSDDINDWGPALSPLGPGPAPANYNVSVCMNLTDIGQTYTMNQSVNTSAAYCIRIQNHSITFDCAGFNITGDSGNTVAVYTNDFNNLTIKNCVLDNVTYGVLLEGSNDTTVFNTNISTITQWAIDAYDSNNLNLTSVSAVGSSLYGIRIRTAWATVIENITLNDLTLRDMSKGGGPSTALDLRDAHNVCLSVLNVSDINGYGLKGDAVEDSSFINLTFRNASFATPFGAIDFANCNNNTISDFYIFNATSQGSLPVTNFNASFIPKSFEAIMFDYSSNNTIYNGIISVSGLNDYPIRLLHDCKGNNLSHIDIVNSASCLQTESEVGTDVENNTFEYINCINASNVGFHIQDPNNYFNHINITGFTGTEAFKFSDKWGAGGIISNNTINNCYLSGTGDTGFFVQSQFTNPSNLKIYNIRLEGFSTSAFIDPGVGGDFSHNNFSDAVVCLNITGWNQSNVSFNRFDNCTTALILNGSSNNNLIFNNTFNNSGTALIIGNGTSNIVYYNRFYNSAALQAFSVAGNDFNTSVAGVAQGNYWDDIFTNNLAIYDSTGDGFGDTGAQYPYSLANGGDVSANVEDYGPMDVDAPPAPVPGGGVVGGGGSNSYFDYSEPVQEPVYPDAERPGFVAPHVSSDDGLHSDVESQEMVDSIPDRVESVEVESSKDVVSEKLASKSSKSKLGIVLFSVIFVLVLALLLAVVFIFKRKKSADEKNAYINEVNKEIEELRKKHGL